MPRNGKRKAGPAPAAAAAAKVRITEAGPLRVRKPTKILRKTGEIVLGTASGSTVDEVQSFELSGETFIDTPLEPFFQLYEKYFVRKLSFVFEPMVATTTDGAVYHYLDTDAEDLPPSKAEMQTTVLSSSYSLMSPVWKRSAIHFVNFRLPDGVMYKPCLYCSPLSIPRLGSMGRYSFYSTGTGAEVGVIKLVYDIEFAVAQPFGMSGAELEPVINKWTRLTFGESMTKSALRGLLGVYAKASGLLTGGVCLSNAGDPTTDSSAKKYDDANTVQTAIVDGMSGVSLQDAAGNAIAEGTRLFLKLTNQAIDTNAGINNPEIFDSSQGTPFVESISTSKSFEPWSIVTAVGAALASYVTLRNTARYKVF